jgi:hypothetical protein
VDIGFSAIRFRVDLLPRAIDFGLEKHILPLVFAIHLGPLERTCQAQGAIHEALKFLKLHVAIDGGVSIDSD